MYLLIGLVLLAGYVWFVWFLWRQANRAAPMPATSCAPPSKDNDSDYVRFIYRDG
jgi:hypothetical protein